MSILENEYKKELKYLPIQDRIYMDGNYEIIVPSQLKWNCELGLVAGFTKEQIQQIKYCVVCSTPENSVIYLEIKSFEYYPYEYKVIYHTEKNSHEKCLEISEMFDKFNLITPEINKELSNISGA